MAFIPIDAKADVQGSKKGKLTPEQHAILNAWCLANKTGILDCLGKCTAKSNVIPIDIISNEATVIFNKGYFVVCGRLVECEEGTTVTLQLSQQNVQQGVIVARFNLSALGNNELQIITVSSSDNLYTEDLNENPITGKYDFVLYDYTADMSLGTVRLTRRGNYIPDLGGKLEEFENNLTAEGKPLGGYDTSKGTIEERLSSLGFKSPVFTNVNTTYVGTGYGGFTEGNITSLYIPTKASSTPIRNVSLATISNIHLPKEDLTINFNSGGGDATVYSVKFTTEGRLELSYTSYGFGSEYGPSFDGEIVIRIYNGEQSVDNKLNWYTTMK